MPDFFYEFLIVPVTWGMMSVAEWGGSTFIFSYYMEILQKRHKLTQKIEYCWFMH